ncbi:hypothetical protein ACHAWF_005755 [Thalassiosira exigua]
MPKSGFMNCKSVACLEAAEADPSASSSVKAQLALELRDSINGSLINVGVLGALMMALACAIYVDPPDSPGACFGEKMLQAEMVIAWMAMGFFFFTTISTVVLYTDMDGIPTEHLLSHLCNSQLILTLPQMSVALGIFMTAIAYGIDIGERGGCPFFYFGIVAAPCFVLSIVVLWLVCRWRRQQLLRLSSGAGENRPVLASYFATWADRVPTIISDTASKHDGSIEEIICRDDS